MLDRIKRTTSGVFIPGWRSFEKTFGVPPSDPTAQEKVTEVVTGQYLQIDHVGADGRSKPFVGEYTRQLTEVSDACGLAGHFGFDSSLRSTHPSE